MHHKTTLPTPAVCCLPYCGARGQCACELTPGGSWGTRPASMRPRGGSRVVSHINIAKAIVGSATITNGIRLREREGAKEPVIQKMFGI
eukprot:4094469-Pyramimonas_sp.AAC.1